MLQVVHLWVHQTITNSQNSLIYGSNSHINSNSSVAFGYKHDISDNTMNSFVSGYGNKDYDGRQNVLFGMEQTGMTVVIQM